MSTVIPPELIAALTPVGTKRLATLPTKAKYPPPKGWAESENQLEPDDPELVAHLERGGNYAVVGGRGLVLMDTDTPETEATARTLPPTFMVQSGGEGDRFHRYYSSDLEKTIPLRKAPAPGEKKRGYGELRAGRAYVVGPGSTHDETGNKYKVHDPRPLVFISEAQLREAFKDYIENDPAPETTTPRRESSDLDNLRIEDVLAAYGVKTRREGSELRYGNPQHGSDSGRNNSANPDKNVWRCHPCQSGGGPLELVAICENIISCEQAKPGGLRGEDFKRTLEAAQNKGLVKDLKATFNRVAGTTAIQLEHITEIENPSNLQRMIEVRAIVSSTTVSYAVPSKVKGTWIADDDAQQSREAKIAPTSSLNMAIINQSTTTRNKILSHALFPESKGHANIKDLSYRTVYMVRVRPPVFSLEKQGDKLVDDKGYEYKAYTIYVIAETAKIEFQASSLLNLKGLVLPDPKTQKTTILVTEVQFPETIGMIDESKLAALSAAYEGKTPRERLDWVVDNFEAYSHVIGRRNIAKAVILGFFTPTWVTLNGELQRGWANILILGDTTTAKTLTVRCGIKLLQAGCIITAETASAVGLVGAAIQLDKGGWGVDWGALVLNDLKLLAVDGAHKLGKRQFASLAEAERSGTVSIVKAAKDSAYARTRQIKIANPLDQESKRSESKNLGDFYYPAQAVPTFLDLMSIARLDLVVFADADDVKPEEVNKKHEQEPDPALFNLGEALKLVWGDRLTLEYTAEAQTKIYEQATALYNEFFCKEIPVASIDLKWKLARLSAAAAALSLSTTDYKTLTVEADHVAWVSDFIRGEYQNAGLQTLAAKGRHEIPTEEQVVDITAQIASAVKFEGDDALERAKELLIWMAERGRFTKAQLNSTFSLSEKNQIRPLAACLANLGLITSGSGYYATAKLNKLVRFTILTHLTTVKTRHPQKTEENTPTEKKGVSRFEGGQSGKDGKAGNEDVESDAGDAPPAETLSLGRLLEDVTDYFRRLNTKTADLVNLHEYIARKKHKITIDEFKAILRGAGYKVDGYSVTIREASP